MAGGANIGELDAAVRDAARAGAPDRYLAALLAPRDVRADLIALAAFSAELEKIPLTVSEPHLGEIRIQWWSDALSPGAGGAKTGNPIADAFKFVIERHKLSPEMLNDYFDASVHGLYDHAPEDRQQLRLRMLMTEGVLISFAARICGAKDVSPDTEIIAHASEAYGLTRLALNLPYAQSQGRTTLPAVFALADGDDTANWKDQVAALAQDARSHLAKVRHDFYQQPKPLRTALLPVAVVEPYLAALTHSGHDAARDIAEIAPLVRTWRIARAHWRGIV